MRTRKGDDEIIADDHHGEQRNARVFLALLVLLAQKRNDRLPLRKRKRCVEIVLQLTDSKKSHE